MHQAESFIKFQMRMPDEINNQLEEAAAKRHISKASIVKLALQAWFDHSMKSEPTCADGTKCLCPVMWQRQAKAPSLER